MIHCNVEICVGCRMCEVACSSFHFGAVSPILSRIRVAKLEEVGIDMAVACFSCVEKLCMVCPTDALEIGQNGEILLEDKLCDACKMCMDACPVGAVGFFDDLPLFCDLCNGETICVKVCPSGALSNIENGEVSLKAFLHFEGNANQKRAHYTEVLAKPVRENWKKGMRIDS